MRGISEKLWGAITGEDTEEIVVYLLTISHPDLEDGDLHVSSDNADLLDFEEQLRGTKSQGEDFFFLPMEVSLPDEAEDASEVVNITISNVTRQLTPLLRSTTTPATVRLQLVLASAPNDIEVEYPSFEIVSADVVAEQVTLTLAVDAMAAEPFPADNFTPSTFGGLWSTT